MGGNINMADLGGIGGLSGPGSSKLQAFDKAEGDLQKEQDDLDKKMDQQRNKIMASKE